jgi:hypothetical protein
MEIHDEKESIKNAPDRLLALQEFIRMFQAERAVTEADRLSFVRLEQSIATVRRIRNEDKNHRDQIGLIAVTKETLAKDLPYLRVLDDLAGIKILVGTVSIKGGPGSHEQENAFRLKLTTMAGLSTGEHIDTIEMKPQLGLLRFRRRHGQSTVIEEGTSVVSLVKKGNLMQVLNADLPFADGPFSAPTAEKLGIEEFAQSTQGKRHLLRWPARKTGTGEPNPGQLEKRRMNQMIRRTLTILRGT